MHSTVPCRTRKGPSDRGSAHAQLRGQRVGYSIMHKERKEKVNKWLARGQWKENTLQSCRWNPSRPSQERHLWSCCPPWVTLQTTQHQREPKAARRSSESRALWHYSYPSPKTAQGRGHRTGSATPRITPYTDCMDVLILLPNLLAIANTPPETTYCARLYQHQ